MSRRVFQLPGRARRNGQVPVAGALLTGQEQQLIADELALLERLSDALGGAEVMPEGVTPTTSVINLLRFGPEPAVTMQADGVIVRESPAEFLDDITIVDTPGTNAIIREHEQLTQQFVPRSDMVLFVTSADRPFTESERAFMESIRDWGKKIVVVINKVDLLRDENAVEEVTEFVRENIERLLGFG